MRAAPPTLAIEAAAPRPSPASTWPSCRLYGKSREWMSDVWSSVRCTWPTSRVGGATSSQPAAHRPSATAQAASARATPDATGAAGVGSTAPSTPLTAWRALP